MLLSAETNADGTYSLEVPDRFGPKARDGLPDNPPQKSPSPVQPDGGTRELSRAPSRILVHLGNFCYDSATGEAEYGTQEEFERAHENFNRAWNQQHAGLPIRRLTGGQFKVAYREITDKEATKYAFFSLSEKPAKILDYVISAGGICSRDDVMNAIWTEEKQLGMKSGERAIYPHINKINEAIEPYRLFIEIKRKTLELRQL